jgi:hypothetical protein
MARWDVVGVKKPAADWGIKASLREEVIIATTTPEKPWRFMQGVGDI